MNKVHYRAWFKYFRQIEMLKLVKAFLHFNLFLIWFAYNTDLYSYNNILNQFYTIIQFKYNIM